MYVWNGTNFAITSLTTPRINLNMGEIKERERERKTQKRYNQNFVCSFMITLKCNTYLNICLRLNSTSAFLIIVRTNNYTCS